MSEAGSVTEAVEAPVRRRAALVSLLVAEGISAIGSKMSFLAVPWLVLVTTGSPTKMGLVGLCQTLPYVVSGIFATPLVDRLGMRMVSILNDLGCAVLVAGIAWVGRADFLLLLALSTVMGAISGVGDRAKRVLLQPVAELAGTAMPRVVTIYASMARINTVLGVAVGGIVIAWVGPVGALLIDAASYVVCALLVVLLVHVPASAAPKPQREPYLASLRGGYAFLREDRLLSSVVRMMFITNLFNQASSAVLVPLWVLGTFGSPVALGWVTGAVALGGILGNLALIGLVTKLPRYLSFVFGYLLAGAPRFLVLGLSHDLATVLIVCFISGVASSTINPAYGALLYERVPKPLQARVFGLTSSVVFGGIPLGGLVGAWFVEGLDLRGALIACGVLYFAATLSPIIGYRVWRRMDDTAGVHGFPDVVDSLVLLVNRTLPTAITGAPQKPVTVSMVFADGMWTVRRGRARTPLAPETAMRVVQALGIPDLSADVQRLHGAHAARAARRVARLRADLAQVEAVVDDLERRREPAPPERDVVAVRSRA